MTQGGGVAAPLGGQILSEVLPYLKVQQGNQEEVELRNEVTIPNVVGKSIAEAEKELKKYNLQMQINSDISEIDKSTIVTNQMPQTGITVYENSYIYLDI
jgi:beta-lactam-binding protein with PASTA domain